MIVFISSHFFNFVKPYVFFQAQSSTGQENYINKLTRNIVARIPEYMEIRK